MPFRQYLAGEQPPAIAGADHDRAAGQARLEGWRSRCGWTASSTLEARRVKLRVAWLGQGAVGYESGDRPGPGDGDDDHARVPAVVRSTG